MFRNPQRPDYSAPFKIKEGMKTNFLKFASKKALPLENFPVTSSPIQYTFTCFTQSSYVLQHQSYLGEFT